MPALPNRGGLSAQGPWRGERRNGTKNLDLQARHGSVGSPLLRNFVSARDRMCKFLR